MIKVHCFSKAFLNGDCSILGVTVWGWDGVSVRLCTAGERRLSIIIVQD